jgi:hypothetical protein
LLAKLSELQKSKAPAAAVARQAETIARSAAAELSATRREAAITAEAFKASQAGPTMSRSEFLKLDHRGRNAAMKSGIRLID